MRFLGPSVGCARGESCEREGPARTGPWCPALRGDAGRCLSFGGGGRSARGAARVGGRGHRRAGRGRASVARRERLRSDRGLGAGHVGVRLRGLARLPHAGCLRHPRHGNHSDRFRPQVGAGHRAGARRPPRRAQRLCQSLRRLDLRFPCRGDASRRGADAGHGSPPSPRRPATPSPRRSGRRTGAGTSWSPDSAGFARGRRARSRWRALWPAGWPRRSWPPRPGRWA